MQSRILLQAHREIPASQQPSPLNTVYRSGTAPGQCRSLLQLQLRLLQVQEKELTNVSTSAYTVAIVLCISVNIAPTNFVDIWYHFQIPRGPRWLKSKNYTVNTWNMQWVLHWHLKCCHQLGKALLTHSHTTKQIRLRLKMLKRLCICLQLHQEDNKKCR